MNYLLQLWTWFNGKKTVIGAFCLMLSTVITQLVIGVNNYHPAWIDAVINNLNYIGEAFSVTGLLHKWAKAVNPPVIDSTVINP